MRKSYAEIWSVVRVVRRTLKLEKNKSHLMFNQTCYKKYGCYEKNNFRAYDGYLEKKNIAFQILMILYILIHV